MSARGLSVPFLRASSKLFRREAPVAHAWHLRGTHTQHTDDHRNGTSSAQLSLARTGSREVGICHFSIQGPQGQGWGHFYYRTFLVCAETGGALLPYTEM